MRVVIIQPHFLPFIGYFDLMNRADIFVYYDTVQFVRRSWHCRTYITENGMARWLSAPVRTAEGSRRMLQEMQWANDQQWHTKIVRRLRQCYVAPKEPNLFEKILELIRFGSPNLSDWNILANTTLAAMLNIKTVTVRASELPQMTGNKQERLISICQELGATRYVCGPGSKSYVRDADFAKFNITVEWLDYKYECAVPTAQGIEVFTSVLDLMLLKGVEATRGIIKKYVDECVTSQNN